MVVKLNKYARNLLQLCKSQEKASEEIEPSGSDQETEIFKLFFSEEVKKVEKSIQKKKSSCVNLVKRTGKHFSANFYKKHLRPILLIILIFIGSVTKNTP